jgi:LEA14-like dessication related protein
MIRAFLLVLALLVAAPSLGGCSAYQAYVQRQAIQQARFNLKAVSLGGLDLAGANFSVVLELENPTDTPIVLDRLDYVLFVNDMRVLAGFTSEKVTVPAHDIRPIAFASHVRYADVGAQLRQILTQGVRTYRLEGVGHFDTPFGTVDYPVKLLGQ